VALGSVFGAVLAAAAGKLLSSVLLVESLDLVSFALAIGVLTAAALAAALVPAWRATRVDPIRVLRAG
jgi:putative ABC transport system permease protein